MDAYVEAAESFEFNRKKFKELVVYASRQCEDDPTFGAIKLNKVLYYADFAAFRSFHRPITGASYRRLREGPAPREFLDVRRELIDSGDASVEYRDYFTGRQRRDRRSYPGDGRQLMNLYEIVYDDPAFRESVVNLQRLGEPYDSVLPHLFHSL